MRSRQRYMRQAAGRLAEGASPGLWQAPEEKFNAARFRRELQKTKRYIKRPNNNETSKGRMDRDGVGYSARGLIAQLREDGHQRTVGDVTVKLAASYGFCWGVERAVQMAYEAKHTFPDRDLHITNEIIHNPTVNDKLTEMEVQLIPESPEGKDFSQVKAGDVVILPAFGASVQEITLLSDRGVEIVDTTCPWVSKVWNAVNNQSKFDHTSIIHGKWAHEETIATASWGGDYLIVKDMKETKLLVDYIKHGGDKEAFLANFHPRAMSEGFDPETMLEKIGVANQTTMLKGETEAIGQLLEKTMLEKYGVDQLKDRYRHADTICGATQDRQDAMYELVQHQDDPERRIDIMIVVGGFNSSNTSHLQEIAEEYNIPSYWVDDFSRINSADNVIEHRMMGGMGSEPHEMRTTAGWLPEGPVTIGITSGASTPDRAVEVVLDEVFRTKDRAFAGIEERDCAPPTVSSH